MPSHANVINTTQGRFAIDAVADAKMARRLSTERFPQEDTLELVKTFGAKRVVDVGAHIGTVSIPLAREGVEVVAFEPNLESVEFLRQNAALNNVAIDIRNKGLSDVPGRAKSVAKHGGNAGAHSLAPGEEVEISTLDREIGDPDFIKIDVEGMELSVLRGGEKLIERARPVIFFEVNLAPLRSHHTPLSSIEKFFNSHDYKLFLPVKNNLYSIYTLFLTTLLITPRSVLFGGSSAVFDVLALPQERTPALPVKSGARGLVYLSWRYLLSHYERLFH